MSISRFDSILDKPRIDFFDELSQIKNGSKLMKTSRLYQFLQPQKQAEVDLTVDSSSSLDHGARIIQQVYKMSEDEMPPLSTDLPDIDDTYDAFDASCALIEDAKQNELWGNVEKYVTKFGTNLLFNATVMMVWKRFYRQFGIRDFLFCILDYTTRADFLPLYRQLVASRINFILHDVYLPIIGGISTRDHYTSFIIIPHRDADSAMNWHVIHINSNGDEDYLHLVDIPYQALELYKTYISDQIDNNVTSSTSMCWENIQGDFGTCGVWGDILAFQLFAELFPPSRVLGADVNQQPTSHSIKRVCKFIRNRMENIVVLRRMHEHIGDLKVSIQYFIMRTMEQLWEDHDYNVKKGDFFNFILHGTTDNTLQLSKKIFQVMCDTRIYLNKHHMTNSKTTERDSDDDDDDDDDIDTDDEKPEETEKRKNRVVKINQHDTNLFYQLVNLKDEMQSKTGDLTIDDIEHFHSVISQFWNRQYLFSRRLADFLQNFYRKKRWLLSSELMELKSKIRKRKFELQKMSGKSIRQLASTDETIQSYLSRFHQVTDELNAINIEKDQASILSFVDQMDKLHEKMQQQPIASRARNSLKRKTFEKPRH